MAAAINWWAGTYEEADEANSKDFENDTKKAMKRHRVLEKYDRVELGAEKKAKELQDSVKRNN